MPWKWHFLNSCPGSQRFFRVEKIYHFYEYKKKIQIFDMSLKEATKLHGTKSFTKAPFVLSWDSK